MNLEINSPAHFENLIELTSWIIIQEVFFALWVQKPLIIDLWHTGRESEVINLRE